MQISIVLSLSVWAWNTKPGSFFLEKNVTKIKAAEGLFVKLWNFIERCCLIKYKFLSNSLSSDATFLVREISLPSAA